MKAWGCLVCLAGAAIALAIPSLAAAKPGYEVRPKSLKLELATEGRNGYDITVETAGHKQVVLTAVGHGGSASYQVDGNVSRHGIEADFGELGHISLRFSGVPKPIRPFGGIPLPPGLLDDGCKGRAPVREAGVFRGSIEFEGEHAFTGVDASRVKGAVRRSYRQVCKRDSKKRFAKASARGARNKPVSASTVELLAAESSPDRHALFGTFSFQSSDRLLQEIGDLFSFVFAAVREHRGAIRITRSVFADVDAGSILVSPPGKQPITVSFAFAKPFAGAAKFVRQPGSPPAWTGSLGVHLPGAGLVPLTGAGFSARLCRIPLDADDESCTKKAEAELGIPSGL